MKTAVTALSILAGTPCLGVTCDQAWNYQFCAYPPLRVAAFPGATVGDQLVACLAALPAGGGVCDARDIKSGTFPAITLSRPGATILGPCGLFSVTGSIIIGDGTHTLSGFRWEGCNGNFNATVGTEFLWAGDAASPMFRVRGVRDSEFERFTIMAQPAAPLATAIQSETAAGTASTHRVYRSIYITGTGQGGLQKGFRWCMGDECGGAGGNFNNDGDYLDNVQVVNYSNCAYSIEHGQSKTHQFQNSTFNGGGFGQRGVCTTQGANPGASSGSFSWHGGLGGGNTVADFDLNAPDDKILIEDCNTESSARLLQTAGSANQWPITIIGCRWSADKLNADNNVVLYQMRGPFNFIGNIIGGVSTQSPQFMINSPGFSRGTAIGNSIGRAAATSITQPFVSSPGNYWNVLGNVIVDVSNNQFPIPDMFAGGVTCQGPPTANFAIKNGVVAAC